jgi:hypothetical protein
VSIAKPLCQNAKSVLLESLELLLSTAEQTNDHLACEPVDPGAVEAMLGNATSLAVNEGDNDEPIWHPIRDYDAKRAVEMQMKLARLFGLT